jgi:hypothetical protein
VPEPTETAISGSFRDRRAHVHGSEPDGAETTADFHDARRDARADFDGEVSLFAREVFRLDEPLLFAIEADENGVAADLDGDDVELFADVERAAVGRGFARFCFEEGGERFAL